MSGCIVKYLSFNPGAIAEIIVNLSLAPVTKHKDLRGHLILTYFTPGATFSHLVSSYRGFSKGLRSIKKIYCAYFLNLF